MDPTGGTLRLIVDSRVPDWLHRNGPRERLGRSWWPTWTCGLALISVSG
jgi:hypothetical protein